MTAPSFPTPWTVGLRVRSTDGARDEWNNAVSAYAPPVARKVYGWGAPKSTEPKLAGRDREVVETELLVPPDFTCRPGDRVILDFDPDTWDPDDTDVVEHQVIGQIEDYNHGPFGWKPGGVVNLKVVSG